MMFTATTMSPAEFFRVMDWCRDHGLRRFVTTTCHDGFHVIELRLAKPDRRFVGFARQVVKRVAWETHLAP